MANDLNSTIKTAAEKIVRYIDNVSTLTVETRVVEVAGGAIKFDEAVPAAKTEIFFDADCKSVVPLRKNEMGVLEIDAGLFEVHEHNVATAIEYRTKMMTALLQMLKQG